MNWKSFWLKVDEGIGLAGNVACTLIVALVMLAIILILAAANYHLTVWLFG